MDKDDDLTVDLRGLHSKGRYAIGPDGYVFDRYLFRVFSGVVVLILLVTFFKLGGFTQYAYASCPVDAIGGKCDNPLYGKCELPACQKEILWAGEELGEKPPSLKTPFFFIFISLVITLLLNHMGQDKPEYEEARKNAERNSNKRVKRQGSRGVNKTLTRQAKRSPKK